MKISGLIKSSLVDYPGKVAAVVFTQGCNFRCGFCHNPELLPLTAQTYISEDDFFNFLKTRQGKLDGVVITGGEPTIQLDLEKFLSEIKQLGFLVKLDTNGSNPSVLLSLITESLIDFVAMDIKGTFSKYQKICGYQDEKNIQKSISLIMKSGLPYEFRTTVLPAYHEIADFEEIGKMLKGAERYAIQGFREGTIVDKSLNATKTFSLNDLNKIRDIMQKYVKEVVVHKNL